MDTKNRKVTTTFATEEFTQAAIEKSRRKIFEIICPHLVEKFFKIEEDGSMTLKQDPSKLAIGVLSVEQIQSRDENAPIGIVSDIEAGGQTITAKNIQLNGNDEEPGRIFLGNDGAEINDREIFLIDKVSGKKGMISLEKGKLNFDYPFEPIVAIDNPATFTWFDKLGHKILGTSDGVYQLDTSNIDGHGPALTFFIKPKTEGLVITEETLAFRHYTYPVNWDPAELGQDKDDTCGKWDVGSPRWTQVITHEHLMVTQVPLDTNEHIPVELKGAYKVEIDRKLFPGDRMGELIYLPANASN